MSLEVRGSNVLDYIKQKIYSYEAQSTEMHRQSNYTTIFHLEFRTNIFIKVLLRCN